MGEGIAEVAKAVLPVGPRGAVPAHRDVRVVRFRKILLHFVPVPEVFIAHVVKIGLFPRQLRMVDPDVGSDGVEPQLLHHASRVGRSFLPGHNGFSPDHRVKMQTGKTGPDGFGPKLIQRGPGVRQRGKPGDQFGKIVERKVGPPFDFPVGGVQKIFFDNVVADLGKVGWGDLARIKKFSRYPATRRKDLNPVVVGPHQGKFNTVTIGRP